MATLSRRKKLLFKKISILTILKIYLIEIRSECGSRSTKINREQK